MNIFLAICLFIKQKLGYAWLLRPHSFSKLTPFVTYLNMKQNPGYA